MRSTVASTHSGEGFVASVSSPRSSYTCHTLSPRRSAAVPSSRAQRSPRPSAGDPGARVQRPLQDVLDDAPPIAILFDQRARGAAVAIVVGLGGGQGTGRFVHVPEPEHALAARKPPAGAGVLYDGGFPAGEIAERPVAHPGRVERDVRWLGT